MEFLAVETMHPLLILLIIILGAWFLLKLLGMRVWEFLVLGAIGWVIMEYLL